MAVLGSRARRALLPLSKVTFVPQKSPCSAAGYGCNRSIMLLPDSLRSDWQLCSADANPHLSDLLEPR